MTGRSWARGQVDQVAIDRACAGQTITLTPQEICAATRKLTTARLSAKQIAERIGVASRTVQRHRGCDAATVHVAVNGRTA